MSIQPPESPQDSVFFDLVYSSFEKIGQLGSYMLKCLDPSPHFQELFDNYSSISKSPDEKAQTFFQLLSNPQATEKKYLQILNEVKSCLCLEEKLAYQRAFEKAFKSFCIEKGFNPSSFTMDQLEIPFSLPGLHNPYCVFLLFQALAFIRDYRHFEGLDSNGKDEGLRLQKHSKKLGEPKVFQNTALQYPLDESANFPIENGFGSEEPIEELEAFVAHCQGRRESQEDQHIYQTISVELQGAEGIEKLKIPLMGILDGHGGKNTAIYAKKQLPSLIQMLLQQYIDKQGGRLSKEVVYHALKLAFPLLRDQLAAQKPYELSGTTICLNLLIGDTLFTANLGDSKAVIGQQLDEQRFLGQELSIEHKPQDQEKGLHKRGSFIMPDFYGIYRINGYLAVGRGIEGPAQHQLTMGICPRPTLTVQKLTEAAVLSVFCDGIGDHLGDEGMQAQEIGAFAAKEAASCLQEAPEKLIRLALQKENELQEMGVPAGDNLSALVVKIPAPQKSFESYC